MNVMNSAESSPVDFVCTVMCSFRLKTPLAAKSCNATAGALAKRPGSPIASSNAPQRSESPGYIPDKALNLVKTVRPDALNVIGQDMIARDILGEA